MLILFRQMLIRYLFIKVVVSTSNHGIISVLEIVFPPMDCSYCVRRTVTLALSSVIFQDNLFLPEPKHTLTDPTRKH